jgi:hypothetical protein
MGKLLYRSVTRLGRSFACESKVTYVEWGGSGGELLLNNVKQVGCLA